MTTTFTDPELQATFERQHRYCRQCHPELGRDWLRLGVLTGVLSGSLAFWIGVVTWLANRG